MTHYYGLFLCQISPHPHPPSTQVNLIRITSSGISVQLFVIIKVILCIKVMCIILILWVAFNLTTCSRCLISKRSALLCRNRNSIRLHLVRPGHHMLVPVHIFFILGLQMISSKVSHTPVLKFLARNRWFQNHTSLYYLEWLSRDNLSSHFLL